MSGYNSRRLLGVPVDLVDEAVNTNQGPPPVFGQVAAREGSRFVTVTGVPVIGEIVIDLFGYYGTGPSFVCSVGRNAMAADVAEAMNAHAGQYDPVKPEGDDDDEEPF